MPLVLQLPQYTNHILPRWLEAMHVNTPVRSVSITTDPLCSAVIIAKIIVWEKLGTASPAGYRGETPGHSTMYSIVYQVLPVTGWSVLHSSHVVNRIDGAHMCIGDRHLVARRPASCHVGDERLIGPLGSEAPCLHVNLHVSHLCHQKQGRVSPSSDTCGCFFVIFSRLNTISHFIYACTVLPRSLFLLLLEISP